MIASLFTGAHVDLLYIRPAYPGDFPSVPFARIAWRLQRCGPPPNALLAFKLLPHCLQLLSALGLHLGEGHVELFQRLQNDVRDE